jgi:hypothetical protein
MTTSLRRIGYAAAAWAAVYATVALFWTVTGTGFPYGEGDPDALGLLSGLPADIGAPMFAGVLVATSVVALVMAGGGRVTGPVRLALQGFGLLVAGALLLVVPDPRVLVLAGYAPVLIVGAPFGWPDVDYAEIFNWPLVNQLFSILGGFLLARAVLAWRRQHTAGAAPAWTAPAAAARWGRWAVAVAVAVPLVYAVTRYAWLLGIPLTVDSQFVDELHDSGAVWAGSWLATFAVIGATLTLGLVQRWGERFPRWLPGLAGRRVPVKLAVVPATVVSVLVTSAGLGLIAGMDRFEWVYLPSLLWPVWGVALAAATLAYHLRRSGRPEGSNRERTVNALAVGP